MISVSVQPCIPHWHHRGSLAPGRGPPWPMAPAPESAPESVAVKFDIKAKMENAQNGQNAIEAKKEEPRESKIQNQSTGTGTTAHYLHDRLCFPAPAHIFWILNSNFCRTLPEKPVRLYVNREDHHLGHLEAEFFAVQAKFHSECPTHFCVFSIPSLDRWFLQVYSYDHALCLHNGMTSTTLKFGYIWVALSLMTHHLSHLITMFDSPPGPWCLRSPALRLACSSRYASCWPAMVWTFAAALQIMRLCFSWRLND